MKKSNVSLFIILLFSFNSFSQTMDNPGIGWNFGLGSLPLMGNVETRSISSENPTGEKGKGGMAIPDVNDPNLPFCRYAEDLGQGWKVNPFLKPKPGETVTIMDIDGPAIIQHIWMTIGENFKGIGRASILRFYWDNEEEPSVEVPLSDFFAVGHDKIARINSLAVIVNPRSALNCYWPMPFRKHVRITFTCEKEIDLLAYQITYAKTDVPENAAYFHAQWRRAVVDPENPDYTILDKVKGNGKYVGTFLSWTPLYSGWFGEGEIKFFINGDRKFPTICGTGTEDYFCGTYGFPEDYTTAFNGCIFVNKDQTGNEPRKFSMYRWHIMDPVYFKNDLKVTIQDLGWYNDQHFRPLDDDIASVAYWYQSEPHSPFPKLPELKDRWPR